jgi:pentatricopeptide repeat protein
MIAQAEKFKQYMSRMQISFDVAAFNCIIDYYCTKGNMHEAFSVYDNMGRYGCSPNVYTYRNLLRGLCKGGHLVQAKEFMACLVDIPSAIDQKTFNALLLGICKDGTLDEALDLCEKMVTSNFLPDIHTYTILLSGFCRKGKIVPAVILLQMMLQKGFVPDIVTYTCLLNGLIKEGQLKVASYLF